MNRPEIHRLYFPGLISLVFLPLMCLSYFLYQEYFEKETDLKVTWVTEAANKYFFERTHFNLNAFKTFENSVLTGDDNQDKLMLKQLRKKVGELNQASDTSKVYSVTFTDKAKYEDIVNVIDICENTPTTSTGFILFGNKALLWKSGQSKYKETPSTDNGGLVYGNDVPDDTGYFQKILNSIKSIGESPSRLVSFWPSAIVFFFMIWFGYVKRKKI